jgi:hypothetical protein
MPLNFGRFFGLTIGVAVVLGALAVIAIVFNGIDFGLPFLVVFVLYLLCLMFLSLGQAARDRVTGERVGAGTNPQEAGTPEQGQHDPEPKGQRTARATGAGSGRGPDAGAH